MLFIAAFGYVPLSGGVIAEGLTAIFQIIYFFSLFSMPDTPGFTLMVFLSVRIAHVFLLHILNTNFNIAHISDAHNNPC